MPCECIIGLWLLQKMEVGVYEWECTETPFKNTFLYPLLLGSQNSRFWTNMSQYYPNFNHNVENFLSGDML